MDPVTASDNNTAKIIRACPSPLDRISSLPDNIIECILSLMPLQYAARTSLLSRSWRNKWRYIPKLVFDNEFYKLQSQNRKVKKDELIWLDIFRILLLHRGTITGLKFCIHKLKSWTEVDKLFLYLCGKTIEEFTFGMYRKELYYYLPSHLFSYDNLRKLTLSDCVFKPPPTFRGLHRLVHLAFHRVRFYCADFHQDFISHCPLLEYLTMVSCWGIYSFVIDFPNLKSLCLVDCPFTSFRFERSPLLATVVILLEGEVQKVSPNCFIRFLDCLPVVKRMNLNYAFLQHLTFGASLERLPTDIQSLQALQLDDISPGDAKEVSWVMCLVMTCPNLKFLNIKVQFNDDDLSEFDDVFEYEDVSDYSSEQLTRLEIEDYRGTSAELEFIKFLLTKLASLDVLVVKLFPGNADPGVMLKDIVQLPGMSPKARIICFNPYE